MSAFLRTCRLALRPARFAVIAGNRSWFAAQAVSPGDAPKRYGPQEVDLKPRDQLRPLLPTWNPPPTRVPVFEELKEGCRLRFKHEDRWWAATVREQIGEQIRVGYDGWPSRHDETVPSNSNRLFLHESFHPEYEAPTIPLRYQRPSLYDDDGQPLPVTPRPPRPKVFDPEKERMKRALRPPLPHNPEKERLKRLLRGQYAPPVPAESENPSRGEAFGQHAKPSATTSFVARSSGVDARSSGTMHSGFEAQRDHQSQSPTALPPREEQTPTKAPADAVEWLEIPGGDNGVRAFRHVSTGELCRGPPKSGWVQVVAEGGKYYFWHVGRKETTWERPV